MNIELRLFEGEIDRGPLPDYATLSLSPVFCDYGSLSFTYPVSGKKFALLRGKDELEIVPYIDGVKQARLGGMVQEISGDDVEDAAVHSFSGLGYLTLLDEGRVYPFGWPGFDPKSPSWFFTDATAGVILQALIAATQARGTLPGITTASFTNTTDSNGVPWAKQLSFEVKPGVTITTVLKSLVDQGMCEFHMVGRDLRVYNAGTLSVDRTVQATPLIFRKGRDLRDSPRKTSSRDVTTVMLAAGKEDAGVYHEEVDAAAVAGRRRIEGYISNGNITDPGTLNSYAEITLAQQVHPKMEKTHGLEFAHKKSPRPLSSFDVGDWAWSDVGQGLERLRIKQWVLSVEANGSVSGSVTMNDMFAEASEKLAKRVDGIVGGTTITGESRAEDVVPGEVFDGIPPAAPTGLVVTSDAYGDDQGHTYAQASASWVAVATNADGTVMEDLGGYRVQWRYDTDGAGVWRAVEAGTGTFVSWSPLVPGAACTARVFAYDKAGNFSAPSAVQPFTTAEDATPPEAPAAPVVDNYLGLLRIRDTGATASGAAVAGDQKGREVHASTVNNFAPDLSASSTTRVDFLSAPGYSFVKAPSYGTTMYAKLVAVDHSGNYSAASAQGSASTSQVVSSDIFAGAVGTLQLDDLAVTTAKINLLAVNSAQIGELEAGKISAGVLSAVVTVSGRIATALTGQRSEMNAIGFQAFDTSNALTINLDGVNNLLTGVFKTAISGRRIEMGAAAALGEINFYAPDGTRAYVRAYTEGTGVEAMQLGIPIAGATDTAWNRVHINSDEWAQLRTRIVDLSYLSTEGGFFVVRERYDRAGTANSTTRLVIDSNGTNLNTPAAGQVRFNERSAGGSLTLRMYMGPEGTWLYRPSTKSFTVTDRDPSGVTADRFRITDDDIWWSWYGTSARLLLRPSPRADTSTRIQMIHPAGFGTTFLYRATAAGAGARVEIMDAVESGYCDLWAQVYSNASSIAGKTDVAPLAFSPRGKLRTVKPKMYRRKPVRGLEGELGEAGPLELGVIAEEMPEEVRTYDQDGKLFGVNVSAQAAMTLGYVQEVDADLQELSAALREISGRLTALENKGK